jgi:predicted transcriptional regulator
MKTISVGIRLPENLITQIDQAAPVLGKRRNDILKIAIAQFVEQGGLVASKSA